MKYQTCDLAEGKSEAIRAFVAATTHLSAAKAALLVGVSKRCMQNWRLGQRTSRISLFTPAAETQKLIETLNAATAALPK